MAFAPRIRSVPAFGRRGFIGGSAALLSLLASLPANARARAVHVATAGKPGGGFVARIIGPDGETLASADLPARGHGNAPHPNGRDVVIFARRPGPYALVVDLSTGDVRHTIRPAKDRHFYGHGAFSPDGGLMFATENDFARDRGILGIYDARDWRRLGEVETHGLGPHQVLRRGGRLYLGNGGILTRPATGRQKLNIDTMEPSLAVFDARDGRLIDQQGVPAELHRLSLRHLAATDDGHVAIAGQWQGETQPDIPLVWTAAPGGALEPLETPELVNGALDGYVGSVEFDVTGRLLAATSPVGGRLVVWDMARRTVVATHAMTDVCALSPEPQGGFLAMSGTGTMWRVDGETGGARRLATGDSSVMWDNHATLLSS